MRIFSVRYPLSISLYLANEQFFSYLYFFKYLYSFSNSLRRYLRLHGEIIKRFSRSLFTFFAIRFFRNNNHLRIPAYYCYDISSYKKHFHTYESIFRITASLTNTNCLSFLSRFHDNHTSSYVTHLHSSRIPQGSTRRSYVG